MITKIATVAILVLVFAGQLGTLASAQDANLLLEPIASSEDLAPHDGFPVEAIVADDGGLSSCCPCPRAYGYAEALFLQRTNGSSDQALILLKQENLPDTTALSTSDLDFGFDPAVRIVLGHRLHNGWAIEGSYLGLFDAGTSAYRTAPPKDPERFSALTFFGGLGAANVFSDMDRVWVNYSSALHSAELNLIRCRGCGNTCGHGGNAGAATGDCGDGKLSCGTFEWLAGFRYLNLSERLHIYAERFQDETEGQTPGLENGVYDIRTSNNLYGPQLGARFRRWGDRWGWEATGKAGLFGNGAHEEQYVLDWDEGGSFAKRPLTSAAGGRVAFVGEVNLTGIYRLTDAWSLRAGYNLIWIAGAALAPDQLDFSGTLPAGNQLRSDASVFLHGVSGGLEARW